MHQHFRKYIDDKIGTTITDADFELIKAVFISKKLRKKQYLLQAGDICKSLSFIAKGAMRQYTVDEKGVEHIVRFGIENWWMADRESFELLTPSAYNIDAWEESELLQITAANLAHIKETVPAMKMLTDALDKGSYIASQKRIHAAISLTAEERYLEFYQQHPVFLQRFPQNMIASYLGVSPETLSRIRKNSLQK
jgi:CRP-like cAMP-binding protein